MVAPSLEAEWVRNHLVKYVSLVPSRIGEVYAELDILQRYGVPHSPNPMCVSLQQLNTTNQHEMSGVIQMMCKIN